MSGRQVQLRLDICFNILPFFSCTPYYMHGYHQTPCEVSIEIHMFLGLLDPDPDPLVKGMDPNQDPSIIKQK
jgi:hypothetical protein